MIHKNASYRNGNECHISEYVIDRRTQTDIWWIKNVIFFVHEYVTDYDAF